jgi:hypothetical protein
MEGMAASMGGGSGMSVAQARAFNIFFNKRGCQKNQGSQKGRRIISATCKHGRTHCFH